MRRKKILCLTSYYLPGFKSGGPLRSLLHMQEWLSDDYEFAVVSRNRDLGESATYKDIKCGTWLPVRGIQVWYLAPPYWRPGPVRAAIVNFQPDALYFHSSVDFSLTIMPLILRRLGLLPADLPVIVAPRGEFSPSARSLKRWRKTAYFHFARVIGLYRGVIWHATKDEEVSQIRALWGTAARVVVAPNLPSKLPAGEITDRKGKQPGTLRLVFLSRISPMKNLDGALEILMGITVPVVLDIYGTREDPQYWEKCMRLARNLPGNIEVSYKGPLEPDAVIPTLAGYDAFFLPTLGENFGHVIHEALLAGCPVLISDRTPWRQLAAARAGFDISLDDPQTFREAIGRLAAMDSNEYQQWSVGARGYGMRYSDDPALAQLTRDMLAAA